MTPKFSPGTWVAITTPVGPESHLAFILEATVQECNAGAHERQVWYKCRVWTRTDVLTRQPTWGFLAKLETFREDELSNWDRSTAVDSDPTP